MEPRILTIDGKQFTIRQPYEAGHVLNEAEAKTLNQTRAENVGNNMRKKVKEGASDADVQQYDTDYEFSVRAAGRKALDPVEKEALKIAKDAVKNDYIKKGIDVKSVSEEEFDAKVERAMSMEKVQELAKKRVAEAKKRAAKEAEALAEIGEF